MATSLPKVLRRIESGPALPSGSAAATIENYQTFLVQCDSYRCLAYRDRDGKWRSAYDNRELTNFKSVLCPLE